MKKNSKFFASLEKKRAESKIISRLNVNGNMVTEPKQVLREQTQYYENLYKEKQQTDTNFNFFDEHVPKLNANAKVKCDGLISENECEKALKEMKNQKSPGSDGLTTEFYKVFLSDIKALFVKAINYSYQTGHLSELQKQSIITLLPKSGKDTSFLQNWRPISLLNVDYKIAAKVIANRIKPHLNSIINESQTGFIKNRYIGENIRLIYEILETTEAQNLPGLVFFSDFEKAFDSVNHEYMYKCLKHFNFGDDLINWVKLFYNDVQSCVSNNGHLSDFFKIRRGVRQGCPLSPFLFIICIELLSNAVRKNEDINGIRLSGREYKTSLFADDAAFIMNGTRKSFETLISIIDNFNYVSGLRLNTSKCQVLRIGISKYTSVQHLNKRKFSWSSDEASCLGMTFHTNKRNIYSANLEPKIKEFEKCLQQWQHRKLTLMGKIVVIKNFALPKLIYPLSSLPNPPIDTIKRLEKIMFNFIWDGKPDKIKRDVLTRDYEQGGLKMIDIEKFILSLKVSWVKRFLQPECSSLLKSVYEGDLKLFGGVLLFECNFKHHDINKHFNSKPFLRDILLAWEKLKDQNVTYNYGNEILWNNSKIRVDDNTVLFKNWHQSGIKYVKDIYNHEQQKLYTFGELREKYNLASVEFLRYFNILNSIPKEWKLRIKFENKHIAPDQKLISIIKEGKLTNRIIYKELMKPLELEITKSQQKWNDTFPNEDLNWKNIYITVHKSTNDVKLKNFQYKFLMRILPTNQFLAKCQLASSTLCDFCNMELETIDHLFWECIYVQELWSSVSRFIHNCQLTSDLNAKTAAFGMCHKDKNNSIQVINFIFFQVKYFIFSSKYRKTIPTFGHFQRYLLYRIQIEKEIALVNDKLGLFEAKWKMVLEVL